MTLHQISQLPQQLIADLSAAAEKAKIELHKVQSSLSSTEDMVSSLERERESLLRESKGLQEELDLHVQKCLAIEDEKIKLQMVLDMERSKHQDMLIEFKVRIAQSIFDTGPRTSLVFELVSRFLWIIEIMTGMRSAE